MNKQEEKTLPKIPLEPHGETHFFIWLENARPILNSRGLCRKAGVSYNLLNKHYHAIDYVRQHGTKTWKQSKLPNKYFYSITKAFLIHTNTVVSIGYDRFQMMEGGVMAVHVNIENRPRLQVITEDEFNGLF